MPEGRQTNSASSPPLLFVPRRAVSSRPFATCSPRRNPQALSSVARSSAHQPLPPPAPAGALLTPPLAGATDLTYSLPGYICVSVCVVATAGYLLLIRRTKDRLGLTEPTLLPYNHLVAPQG
mmetsp:Transcript_24140/g.67668  ORF Transcript_24140/g.67668 Transcript_24140/m.67668 type:complete len:122 (-) Transcript_24140:122-487(-)